MTRELLPSDVHVDAVLSNFAYEYSQNQAGFIGETVFPPLDVDKQSDLFFVGDKSTFTLESDFKRAPGAEYDMVTWTLSDDNYYCDSFGISTALESEVLANQDALLRLGQKAARVLVQKFQLLYEKRVADTFFNATNFSNGGTLTAGGTGAGYQWSDYTNSTPIDDIADATDAVADLIFQPANTAVMGYSVWKVLRRHPDILQGLYGTTSPRPIPTPAAVAELLDLDRIIIGNVKYNVGGTLTQIWGDYCAVCYLDPNAGRGTDQVVVPGRTFVWNVDGVGRYQVSSPEYRRNRKSYVWYCDDYTDEKVISADAVYLFSDCTA